MSQITTHILDTSIGKPAEGVAIHLYKSSAGNRELLGSGVTNADGRVTALLPDNNILEAGTYSLRFETAHYYQNHKTVSFYPYVEIAFQIAGDGQHYHVPLLLNPYGYSTYRGS